MHYTHTPQSAGLKLGPGWPPVELSLYIWIPCLQEPMGGGVERFVLSYCSGIIMRRGLH